MAKLINKVEKTEDKSHQMVQNADSFAIDLAEFCMANNILDPIEGISKLLANKIRTPDFKFGISGSFFTGFKANALNSMVQKVLKVYFGSSPAMLRGSMIHLGAEIVRECKLQNKPMVQLSYCVQEMRKYLENKWNYCNPKYLTNSSKYEVFKEAVYAFKLLYKVLLTEEDIIEVENGFNLGFPIKLFSKPQYAKHFVGNGTFDALIEETNEDGTKTLVMSDLKTSKRISGTCEKSDTLIQFEGQIKVLTEAIALKDKIIKKYENAQSKLSKSQEELASAKIKLEDAIKNGKATKRLEGTVANREKDFSNWKENYEILLSAQEKKADFEKELEELLEVAKPQLDIYEEDKKAADLVECKKLHQEQLAYYAILEYHKSGRKIEKLKVQNVVIKKARRGTKTFNVPEYQEFEWELDDMTLAKIENSVTGIIRMVEMVMDGVEPMYLFRNNITSFFGTEIQDILDEVEKIIQLKNNTY